MKSEGTLFARYVVTELEGYNGTTTHPGLSCMVVDVPYNRRVVATYRSEDYGGWRSHRHNEARYRAERHAARLNGEAEPPLPAWRFRPTCPHCRRRADPEAAYCKCGANLYRQEIGH